MSCGWLFPGRTKRLWQPTLVCREAPGDGDTLSLPVSSVQDLVVKNL